jgi:hypothetical protein
MLLLLAMSKRYPNISQDIELTLLPDGDNAEWLGVTYSVEPDEVGFLLRDYLQAELSAVDGSTAMSGYGFLVCRITPRGFAILEELRSPRSTTAEGFCAMWFHDSVRAAWTDAIKPAIALAGYRPVRLDEEHHANKIDDEIVAAIRRSKFVVADFTEQSANVYYEAGFAEGLQKTVICTVREDNRSQIKFDARQNNFIRWSPDALVIFQKQLKDRIEALLGHGPILGE